MSSPDEKNPKRICGAKNRKGEPCRLKPLFKSGTRGNGRCKHHGGLSTGPTTDAGKAASSQNAVKHGFYARKLRETLDPEGQEIFDAVPRNTDLSEEIAIVRADVYRYRAMLARGELWIYTKGKGASHSSSLHGESASYSEAAVSVEDLYQKSVDLLRRLTQAQQDMHPGAGMKGDLLIRVSVSDGKEAAQEDQPVPDLVEGQSEDSPLETPPEDSPEEEPKAKGSLDDFD